VEERKVSYLSHICTYLPYLSKELYSSHPFIEAESCFAREVVEMGYEALHHVLQSRVGTLRINAVDVLGDVFDCEVFELGD
jgi:hypothetical protein